MHVSCIHVITGLVGLKSGKVKKRLVFKAFLKGSKEPGVSQECKESAEKYRLGGGRGRVNPPPRRLVWRFLEVWRVR